jgi:hypothetical protein
MKQAQVEVKLEEFLTIKQLPTLCPHLIAVCFAFCQSHQTALNKSRMFACLRSVFEYAFSCFFMFLEKHWLS